MVVKLREFEMDTDDLLFKELNKHSFTLRNSARELAELLVDLRSHTLEITNLIAALKKFETAPIDHMDIAVDDLKNALLILSTKMSENKSLLQSPDLMTILEKNFELTSQVIDLQAKAIEINKACLD
jgi:hypothetical protein